MMVMQPLKGFASPSSTLRREWRATCTGSLSLNNTWMTGRRFDEVVRSLLAAGAGPIGSIKAIRSTFGVDLGEAKVVVDRNLPPGTQASNERLRATAVDALLNPPEG